MSATKKQWSYDEVQALIHAVRENPSLYDRRDPDYNQTRTKEVKKNPILSHLQCTNYTFSNHIIFRILGNPYQRYQRSSIKVASLPLQNLSKKPKKNNNK